jgi:hypothetical protein
MKYSLYEWNILLVKTHDALMDDASSDILHQSHLAYPSRNYDNTLQFPDYGPQHQSFASFLDDLVERTQTQSDTARYFYIMERFPFSLRLEQSYIMMATSPKTTMLELLLQIKVRLPTTSVYNEHRLEKAAKGHNIENRKYFNHNSIKVDCEIYEYLSTLDLYSYHFGDRRTFREFLDTFIDRTRTVYNHIHRIQLLREVVFQAEYRNAIPRQNLGTSWTEFIKVYTKDVMGFANYNTITTLHNQPHETQSYLQSKDTTTYLRSDNRSRHYTPTTNYPRNISGINDKTQPMSYYDTEGGTFEETLDEHVPQVSSSREHPPDIIILKNTSRYCMRPPFGLSPRCPCVGHDNHIACDCPCWCPCSCESSLRLGHYCETCDPQRNIYIHN